MSSPVPGPDRAVPSGAPDPVVNVRAHLRELWSAAPVALVFGIVVGVVVLVARGFWPATYEVVTTARVWGPSASSANQVVAQSAGAPFVALAGDQAVLDRVAERTGVGADEVRGRVTVAMSEAPGFITVTARDGDLANATELGAAMVEAMDGLSVERSAAMAGSGADDLSSKVAALDDKIRKAAAAGGDQSGLSSLYTQRDELTRQLGQTSAGDQPARLSLLAVQTNGGAPVSPRPMGEAGVAGLVAAILAAEAIVLANGRMGRKVSPSWGRLVAGGRSMDVDSGPAGESGLPVATDIVRNRLLREEGILLFLTSPGSDPLTPATGEHVLAQEVVHEWDRPWWHEVPLDRVVLALVVVDEGRDRKSDVEEVLDRLELVDVPTRLVVREHSDFSGPFGWLKI